MGENYYKNKMLGGCGDLPVFPYTHHSDDTDHNDHD